MGTVIRKSKIAEDCGVMIEFCLPSTSLRIDFIVSGRDSLGKKNFIIIELKQWKEAQSTSKKDLVLTKYYSGNPSTHPSYQASSYKMFLSDYNENVYNHTLTPFSCAYLHNYKQKQPEPLLDSVYEEVLKDSPIYFKDDYEKLELFIKHHVGYGNGKEILYEIESGNIKPSKKLIDHVVGLFRGNKEFHLLEEQKVAFEIALDIGKSATKKTVLIIKGGPGTGKSVISMSLLGELLKGKKNVVFVAPNASFREVMLDKLTRGEDSMRAKLLISGSGKYYGAKSNVFDVIVADEAHRLKNGSAFMYKGDNQIDDIINAARVSILFIDEDQLIRPEDIGSIEEITRIAKLHKAEVIEMELTTQFRCAGADGYVNWINDVLRIKDTANFDGWDKKEFEFKIVSDPVQLRSLIIQRSSEGHNARMLAGYAWNWSAEGDGNSDSQINDVVVPEFKFAMPWNSRKVGTTWAINQRGINQIGCVHTSQGLEFDYVGIIVGDDLKYDIEFDEYFTDWNAYKDVKGKSGMKSDPEKLCRMVRNIYRILMTRGMKGCYVYFTDKATESYFKKKD
ncbi:MAG: DUF2075 domain-containing protein [Saprospiraceae bacterium]|uniref:DUF2075 domain-containing protein n=1 Tax=Candidatus Opimibacter skivensis TaxID=2982028 RepID=A0A9D7SUR7_9BACT|nr:DUF2075 domain-containing protein [Candidatus Opimibacter skivensis]